MSGEVQVSERDSGRTRSGDNASPPALETKTAFAKRCNVTPGRVSQWIAEGKISPASIEGDGRRAKIRVMNALTDLQRNLDPSQRLGNGASTRLSQSAAQEPNGSPAAKTSAELLADERLRSARMTNQRLAEEEAARRGIYTRTDEVRAGLKRVGETMMRTFEGALPDLATAIAAKFEVPQRDVVHLLKQEFRKVQEKASETARNQASSIEAFREEDVEILHSETEGEA